MAHLVNLKFTYEKKKDCLPLYTKITISLIRYCDIIRLDKLYYEAGLACKSANQLGMASIFLNRYLDLNEIIEDPENGTLPDSNDFDITDIPSPYDVAMPVNNFITNEEKEKIKNYLLQVTLFLFRLISARKLMEAYPLEIVINVMLTCLKDL